MKYNSTIKKADDFTAVLMTQNGYPVYDIMVPIKGKEGYCTASGLAFYTEEEDTLKKFNDFNREERRDFLLNNQQYIKSIPDIFKESPEMHYPLSMAYKHLVNDFEGTIRKHYYGSAHLMVDGTLKIFHQHKVYTGVQNMSDDFRKEFNEIYDSFQKEVAKVYKDGKLEADGEITGKALERLKAKNPQLFKETNKYQGQIMDILKSFKNELLDQCKLTYEKGNVLIVNMEINNQIFKVTIPEDAKTPLILSVAENDMTFKKISDLIMSVYQEVSHAKFNSFISRVKMK